MNADALLSLESHLESSRAPIPGQSSSARVQHEAYLEYCRLRSAGEPVDLREFCGRFPSLGKSFLQFLEVHELLDEAPDILDNPSAHWPQVGAVWESFHLVEELGQGAFSRVYLARELLLGERLVALKCTSLGTNEAATLGRLNHPHIVPIYSIRDVPENNLTAVCMPYLGHATLDQVWARIHHADKSPDSAAVLLEACADPRLAAGPIAAPLKRGSYVEGVCWIAARIADAMAHLHANGVCHRDLKPSNVLLEPNGNPRLLDFNLSHDALAPQTYHGGTLPYMAPEQVLVLGTKVIVPPTPKVDVFGLGVILYEWLTGAHPFGPFPSSDKIAHLREAHRAGPPSLRGHPLVEPSLARIIERCLAYQPEDRPTASELTGLLQAQLRWPRRLQGRARRHPFLAVCLTALLTTAAAWGAYRVATQAPPSETAFRAGVQAFRDGDHHQALDHLQQAMTLGADSAECLFLRARVWQKLGEQNESNREFFDLAIAAYKESDQRKPRAAAVAGMGYCSQRLRLRETAELYYQQALGNGHAPALLHHNLGCIYHDLAKLDKAQEQLERAVALDESLHPAQLQLARVLFRKALRASVTRNSNAGDSRESLLRRALTHLQAGSAEAANAHHALLAAQIHALAVGMDERHREPALDWAEHAANSGVPMKMLRDDPIFQPLQNETRFKALLQRARSTAMEPWVAILDPVTE